MKPGSLTEIIVTFRIKDETNKEALLTTMKDSDSSLANDLTTELASAGTGATLNGGADGITNGAITDVVGKITYLCEHYLKEAPIIYKIS